MAHGISIDHDEYIQQREGLDDVSVDRDFVDRFLSAAPFFDDLVSAPETHEQDADGTITVTQTTPDGDTRVTAFIPLDESPR